MNMTSTTTLRPVGCAMARILAGMLMCGPAVAQTPPGAMPMAMPPAASPSGDASPSSQAFKAANDRMMTDMSHPLTGDADQDFVAGMLPHHQGAVDMARVELQYGKDPRMKRLARRIIAAQQTEIAQMQAWRKAHTPK